MHFAEKHSNKAASQPMKNHNSSNDNDNVPHQAKDTENRYRVLEAILAFIWKPLLFKIKVYVSLIVYESNVSKVTVICQCQEFPELSVRCHMIL